MADLDVFNQDTYIFNVSKDRAIGLNVSLSFDILDANGNKLLKLSHSQFERILLDNSGKTVGRIIVKPQAGLMSARQFIEELYDGADKLMGTVSHSIEGNQRHAILKDSNGIVLALSTSDMQPYVNHVAIGNADGSKTIAQINKGVKLPNRAGGITGFFQNISNNTLGHTINIEDKTFPRLLLLEFASCNIIT